MAPHIIVGQPVTVDAVFDRLNGRPAVVRACQLLVSRVDDKYGPVVQMHGGPTGYESFYARDFFDRRMSADAPSMEWVACAGTPGQWQRCTIADGEMRYALTLLGLM